MARQSTTPVTFNQSVRGDTAVTMTSGRAGKVVPVGFFPVLRGDSASGRVGIDIQLAEMPRPLLNGVQCNMQAWFVPKSAHPQFAGQDEFMHSYTGETIKALGQADRTPPPFFNVVSSGATLTTIAASEFFKTLGLHIPANVPIQTDLVDAFALVYNFRLAAHSSRLARRKYFTEDMAEALSLPRAFWPTSRFSRVVPDYERALVLGNLDLDIAAGQIPVSGLGKETAVKQTGPQAVYETGDVVGSPGSFAHFEWATSASPNRLLMRTLSGGMPAIYAEMANQTIGTTLADIDKARVTQAMAKLRTAYAGNDATGFDNDDAIVATLMQGLSVPEDQFKRPWLLDSKRVGVGFAERFATDAANLDASVTLGRASATLSLNVPRTDVGGVVLFTVEIVPERLDERQSDEWLHCTTPDALPNALRDVQRPEPVDLVANRRLDAKHSTPAGLYGYEPMNDKWNRSATRLGGSFYQATPGAEFTEQRSAIWLTDIVNPVFSDTHYLVPANFPHTVFADTEAPAFEVVARHDVKIVGLTQIGDVLAENNDDYQAVEDAG